MSPSDLNRLIDCFDIVKGSDEDVRTIFSGEGLSDGAIALHFLDAGPFGSVVAVCVIEKTDGVRAHRMPSEADVRRNISGAS